MYKFCLHQLRSVWANIIQSTYNKEQTKSNDQKQKRQQKQSPHNTMQIIQTSRDRDTFPRNLTNLFNYNNVESDDDDDDTDHQRDIRICFKTTTRANRVTYKKNNISNRAHSAQ